jgi:hypothetical protein
MRLFPFAADIVELYLGNDSLFSQNAGEYSNTIYEYGSRIESQQEVFVMADLSKTGTTVARRQWHRMLWRCAAYLYDGTDGTARLSASSTDAII